MPNDNIIFFHKFFPVQIKIKLETKSICHGKKLHNGQNNLTQKLKTFNPISINGTNLLYTSFISFSRSMIIYINVHLTYSKYRSNLINSFTSIEFL